MNQWLQQYDAFQKERCEQMLCCNRESRETVRNNSITVAQIQEILQEIENAWASDAKRDSAPVRLIVSQGSSNSLFGQPFATNTKHDKPLYNYTTNRYRIPWSVNAYKACDFQVLFTLRHEAEHAAQSVGFGYTQDEAKLIWIERACGTVTKGNYWVRFREMTARMNEAEFCAAMLTTHKSHLSAYDQQNILSYLTHTLLRTLNYKTTQEELEALQQAQKHFYNNKLLPAKYLGYVFPDVFALQRNAAALDFLEHTAPAIYENCFRRLQAVHKQLSQYVAEWQQTIPATVAQYERRQETERLRGLAQQYGLPTLTALPQGADILLLRGDLHAEQYIRESIRQRYNPALVLNNRSVALVYDTAPTPRPYSISPELRSQWQAENQALPHEVSNDAMELDAYDEIDDL